MTIADDGGAADTPERAVRPTTRFAPAPTGYLHLGHVLDAIHVWGIARAAGGGVVLRIEDHDRQRCRHEYETALLDDLDWLGLAPDAPATERLRAGPSPYRQSDDDGPYAAATERLARRGLVYACDCTRSTFEAWARSHGRRWTGPRCPAGCADRSLEDSSGRVLRVALGDGDEAFEDLLLGPLGGRVSPVGDLPIRDRHGNRTYGFAVVVDDIRHGIDLVIRGRDLVEATPAQIRLGRLLGRDRPPLYGHHPLILRPDGAKLSKADGDTGIRDLRAAGWTPEHVLGAAAAAIGLVPPGTSLAPDDLPGLFEDVAARLG